MSRIMMDNRGLTDAISGMYNIKNVLYRIDLADFLTYFVLWDEIYYPKSSMDMLWRGVVKEEEAFEYIRPIDTAEIGLYHESEIKVLFQNVPGEYKSTIQYWLFSNQYGLDYCPSKSNSEFLARVFNYELYNVKKDILDRFSKDVFDNYMRFRDIRDNVVFPSIGDYIIRNTDEGGRYFKTAIDVKNDTKFKAFKRYIDKLEEQVGAGSIVEYRKCIKDINDMTKEIGGRENDILRNVSFSISLIPFSLSVNAQPRSTGHRDIQLNFLKNVAEYYLR